MAIRDIVTLGFGTGSFNGTIAGIVTLGFIATALPASGEISSDDAKYNKMATALGYESHISDMEVAWLQSLDVSVTDNDIAGAWNQYLDSQLIPAGDLNDRWFTWMGSLGHTGSLPDRWSQYWSSP